MAHARTFEEIIIQSLVLIELEIFTDQLHPRTGNPVLIGRGNRTAAENERGEKTFEFVEGVSQLCIF